MGKGNALNLTELMTQTKKSLAEVHWRGSLPAPRV